jgi:hypothetical protein
MNISDLGTYQIQAFIRKSIFQVEEEKDEKTKAEKTDSQCMERMASDHFSNSLCNHTGKICFGGLELGAERLDESDDTGGGLDFC